MKEVNNYKNINSVVISKNEIDVRDLIKLKSIFNLIQIVKSEKALYSEYVKQNNIKFAIIYNHEKPIDFSIKVANELKNINKIHSIIISNEKFDEEYLKLNHIEIIKDISELEYKKSLIHQKKLFCDNQNSTLDFFLNLSELIKEIVIITNTENEIIYINEKGSKNLNLPLKTSGNKIKVTDIDIRDWEKLKKIDLSYHTNSIPEFKNILITNCILTLKNNKKLYVDVFISTIDQNNIDKLITIKEIPNLNEIENYKYLEIIDSQDEIQNAKEIEKLLVNHMDIYKKKKIYLLNLDLFLTTEYEYKEDREKLNIKILKIMYSKIMSLYSEYIFKLKNNNLIVIICTSGDENQIISIAQKIKKTITLALKKEDIIIFKFNIGIIEVNLRENLELKIPKLMMATKISSEYKDSNPIIYKEELPEAVILKNQNKIFQYILKAIKMIFLLFIIKK